MAQAKGNVANNPISEIALAFFVIALILILLIEVPNWVINFSISLNITLGIVLLMFSLYVQKPLELASFPSIILIGTMFRLVLSIKQSRGFDSCKRGRGRSCPCVRPVRNGRKHGCRRRYLFDYYRCSIYGNYKRCRTYRGSFGKVCS